MPEIKALESATPATAQGPGVAKPPPKVGLTSLGGVLEWGKKAGGAFSTVDGSLWSASFAYYAFFALFPLLLLLVTIGTDVAARFVGEEKAQAQAFSYTVGKIGSYVPLGPKDYATIQTTVQEAMKSRGSIGLVAFGGLLWSSLGFFQALVGAINKAWGQKPLNWWKLPLKNLAMMGILVAMLLLGVIAPAVLKTAQSFLSFEHTITPKLFYLAGVLAPTVVLFCGFLLFYKFAPRGRTRTTFGIVWLPALIVTALLQLCQQAFVFYTTHITNFNAIYGTFGGVIALMLWTYLTGMIVIFGGCLCATLRETPEPNPALLGGGVASTV